MTVQTPNGSLNWKSILSVPLPTQTFSATNTLLAHESPMGLAMYLWAILSQESTYMGEMKSRTSYSPGKASSRLEQQAARSGQMTTSSSASIPKLKKARPEGVDPAVVKGRSFWHISTATVGTPNQNLPTSIFLFYCRRHLANTLIYRRMCQFWFFFLHS